MELKYVTPSYSGLPSFFRLPLVTSPSGLDIALLGVPFDGGQSLRTGSRFAPAEIRRASAAIRRYNPSLDISPYDMVRVADLGDSAVNPLDTGVSRELIRTSVGRIIDVDALPVLIGGDHSITLPILRALAAKHGPLGLVHVDSHLDAQDDFFGTKYGGGTWARRAVEENLIARNKWIQIGTRGAVFGKSHFDFVQDYGARLVTMDDICSNGINWALDQLDWLRDTPCYVTFDIDAIDPAFAPGTTGPEPGGLTSIDGLKLVRHLGWFSSIVGFDIVEVQPMYDAGSITSILAAHLIFEFLSAYALARRNAG